MTSTRTSYERSNKYAIDLICHSCNAPSGHVIAAAKSTLTAPLIDFLSAHYERGGGVLTLKQLGLPGNLYSTYPHLCYWGLIQRPTRYSKSLKRDVQRRAHYYITELGEQFITDQVRVHKSLWSAKGQRIEWDTQSPMVTASEVLAANEPLVVPGRLADIKRFGH